MNRYKWLAQYILRMKNKEIYALINKYPWGITHRLPRFTLVKDYDFLSFNYYIRFTICTKTKNGKFVPRVKTFRISEKDYNTIMEGFK